MRIFEILKEVKLRKPLVHHLTNWVTIYDCASMVKAFGASPVMAHSAEEVGEMSSLASALVLNIGTLTSEFVESMKIAAKAANEKGIPVVLDVCGAGATRLRDDKSMELLKETRIDIIKGNASEIARIAGLEVQTKGVDSSEINENPAEVAANLAGKYNCTVVITGKSDFVSDGKRTFRIDNGHEMMSQVVGTGCMATSVIGTFAAVEPDHTAAAVAGLVCYNIAGQLSAIESSGPYSFKNNLLDQIYNLDRDDILKLQRVVEL